MGERLGTSAEQLFVFNSPLENGDNVGAKRPALTRGDLASLLVKAIWNLTDIECRHDYILASWLALCKHYNYKTTSVPGSCVERFLELHISPSRGYRSQKELDSR